MTANSSCRPVGPTSASPECAQLCLAWGALRVAEVSLLCHRPLSDLEWATCALRATWSRALSQPGPWSTAARSIPCRSTAETLLLPSPRHGGRSALPHPGRGRTPEEPEKEAAGGGRAAPGFPPGQPLPSHGDPRSGFPFPFGKLTSAPPQARERGTLGA